MGFFRFRRSIRLMPGIRINLGKRSASVSIGVQGAHVTLGGPQGTRTTVGLPGTGLSYTETTGHPQVAPAPGAAPGRSGAAWWWLALLLAIAAIAWWAARL